MKAVLDTNVIVSAGLSIVRKKLDSPNLAVFSGLFLGRYTHISSEPLLFEMAEVLLRPKFALPGAFVIDLMSQIAQASEIVPIRGLSMGCPDPDDDKFVEAAVNGRIDYLVTRDPDLYDRRTRYGLEKRNVQILPASAFLEVLELTPSIVYAEVQGRWDAAEDSAPSDTISPEAK